ncbi:MAG TPA: ABC transporter ATP-binding protein [Solirubrobacteraceae bacterium]|nr:ABC transporter ATP-binding protein [Solirubrobacteraceae bacterium]
MNLLQLRARGAPQARDTSSHVSFRGRLNVLIGAQRRLVVLLVIIAVLSAFTEAAMLAAIAEVAVAIAGAGHKHSRISLIHVHASVGTLLAIAFGFALLRLFLQFPLSMVPARIASSVQAGLRIRLFHSFSRASWEVQSRDREGQLQETMTSQVLQATGGVLSTTGLVTSMLTLLVLLASAFALNATAAAIVLVLALGMFGLLRPLRNSGVRHARALSRAQVQYAAGIAESIRVAEEMQVFGAGAAQRSRIDELIEAARRNFFTTQLLLKLTANLYQCTMYVLFVVGLWALYHLGKNHTGSLAAVVLIIVRASTSGQSVQGAYQGLIQAMPFIERTQDAEQRYRESIPPVATTPLPAVSALAFEDVSYAYRPGRPVLSQISFQVQGGEVVGVIGPSGAGKSTLVQLLLRLRRPDGGRYLVNGTDAWQFAAEDWNRRVAYVPQEPRLLHASVADNIRYFREIDDDAVERAGRLARIHEDVMGWADGYETIVGPRADAVSGGQQQRICLARALAALPGMLVLDEPTSALDPHSETLIQESLTGLKHELTLFIVAHRMSTLDICDRVMIIIDGRLTAFDTIAALREHNHYYRSASKLAVGAPGGALP